MRVLLYYVTPLYLDREKINGFQLNTYGLHIGKEEGNRRYAVPTFFLVFLSLSLSRGIARALYACHSDTANQFADY